MALLLALTTIAVGVEVASASTISPCTNITPGLPYLDLVVPEQGGMLQTTGHIGGCPFSLSTQTITGTTCLQFEVSPGVWVDQSCEGPITKSKGRFQRFPLQLDEVTPLTECFVGSWRTHFWGETAGPFDKYSEVVDFREGDSEECGAFGGGD